MKRFKKNSVKRLLAALTAAVVLVLPTSRLAAQSDTTEVRPSDLPPMGAVDDPLQLGKDATAEVAFWEERVRGKLAQIDEMLKSPLVDLKTVQAQGIAKELLLEMLDDLDDESRAIIAAHGQVAPDLRGYKRALEESPAIFLDIAKQFDAKAGEDKDPFFKEGYADFSASARRMAASYEERAKGVDSIEQELASKIAFVHMGRQFVADARPFVEAIPTDYGEDTEKLLERINQWVAVLEDAMTEMKRVANELGEQPDPGAKPAKPAPMSSLDIKDRAAPLTIDEYRRRLAQIRR